VNIAKYIETAGNCLSWK